jgi:hypothetical protein
LPGSGSSTPVVWDKNIVKFINGMVAVKGVRK